MVVTIEPIEPIRSRCKGGSSQSPFTVKSVVYATRVLSRTYFLWRCRTVNNPKLLEAIAELKAQREIMDNAILHLTKALEALGGGAEPSECRPDTRGAVPSRSSPSYTVQAEEAITTAGRALHINEIIDYIANIRGERPTRTSVESGILHYIKKLGPAARIFRSGKSTFDVRKSLSIAS